jgi:hypothetical protein
MWIQLNNAFLSIVENRGNKAELLVRARIKGDIEKIFPEENVCEDKNADYKYRVFIPKDKVADIILKKINEINYDNFKNSIPKQDHERYRSYSNVWVELRKLQK